MNADKPRRLALAPNLPARDLDPRVPGPTPPAVAVPPSAAVGGHHPEREVVPMENLFEPVELTPSDVELATDGGRILAGWSIAILTMWAAFLLVLTAPALVVLAYRAAF